MPLIMKCYTTLHKWCYYYTTLHKKRCYQTMKQFFIIKQLRCDLILKVLYVKKNMALRIGEIWYFLTRNWSQMASDLVWQRISSKTEAPCIFLLCHLSMCHLKVARLLLQHQASCSVRPSSKAEKAGREQGGINASFLTHFSPFIRKPLAC